MVEGTYRKQNCEREKAKALILSLAVSKTQTCIVYMYTYTSEKGTYTCTSTLTFYVYVQYFITLLAWWAPRECITEGGMVWYNIYTDIVRKRQGPFGTSRP